MNALALAASAAASISSMLASGLPYAMFSAMVAGRMIGCCRTRPIWARRSSSRSSRRSTPSSSTAPFVGSKKRGSRFNKVVLPAPLGPMIAADVPAKSLKLT
jgi:hypothetical protein